MDRDIDQYMNVSKRGYLVIQDHSKLQYTTNKLTKVKGQSWGFTSRSTARVILGQVLRIATCGTRTHRGDSL